MDIRSTSGRARRSRRRDTGWWHHSVHWHPRRWHGRRTRHAWRWSWSWPRSRSRVVRQWSVSHSEAARSLPASIRWRTERAKGSLECRCSAASIRRVARRHDSGRFAAGCALCPLRYVLRLECVAQTQHVRQTTLVKHVAIWLNLHGPRHNWDVLASLERQLEVARVFSVDGKAVLRLCRIAETEICQEVVCRMQS